MILSVHIDDMLLSIPNKKQQMWFEKEISKSYNLVKQYNTISYLGMTISKNPTTGSISLSQEGMLKSLLLKYGVHDLKKPPSTPATEKRMDHDPKSPKLKKKSEYLSLITSLMYLARFTRPDILMPVPFLATRCSDPTKTGPRQ
jgi:hypothetical protein